MAVVQLDIRRQVPYEAGRTFGSAGPYELVEGVASFAVDPLAQANAGITDLALAPRDERGRVGFSADFCVLRPVSPAPLGSRRLLFSVANRGRRPAVPFSALSAPLPTEVTERIEPGDGFLLRRGWTVAWCGWQWDVVRRPGTVGLDAPRARLPETAPPGEVLVQFQPHVRQARQDLGHWPLDPPPGMLEHTHTPYRPLRPDDPAAVLAVRAHPAAEPVAVPRDRWRFVEGGCAVELDGGFEPGSVYDVRFRPSECPVVGAGLLAVRDFVAHLRPEFDHAFAFGVSQSGRFLREFLFRGLNVDEAGGQVFDGVLVHVAGARRGEFNQRYGQPSVQHAPGLGHLPPFGDGGLLARQRALGGVPRVFSVNTSSEYWRSEASLTHEVEPPAEVRTYLFAGCQHGPGAPALTRSPLMSPWVQPANCLNTVDYTPLLRAALVNLERWAADGAEPPPSAVPRLADGTAVERAEVLRRFAGIPAALPRPDRLPALRRLDLGPDADSGAVQHPAGFGESYACLVSSVDADGNEEAGVRLPDLTVPLATHTGWNPRRPESGGDGQLLDMLGSSVPLARTRARRERTGDPRPSIEERYGDRDEYCRLVRRAAERLAAARQLLAEDVEPVVARAGASWDAIAGHDDGV
ncbi:MAG TPA: alpha/beta hydrolase domain-containing protein [Candidatus Dormibacteraeota bacterium]|nr:alpha/beta hydrolase domain-containing protein [Candidatus Dormibacteraeota bacterium]